MSSLRQNLAKLDEYNLKRVSLTLSLMNTYKITFSSDNYSRRTEVRGRKIEIIIFIMSQYVYTYFRGMKSVFFRDNSNLAGVIVRIFTVTVFFTLFNSDGRIFIKPKRTLDIWMMSTLNERVDFRYGTKLIQCWNLGGPLNSRAHYFCYTPNIKIILSKYTTYWIFQSNIKSKFSDRILKSEFSIKNP